MQLRRIRIIGGPGSGKTYLSKMLSKKYKLPHYDLDDFFWENKTSRYGIEKDPSVRDKEFSRIVKKEKWIIEGVYGPWAQESFQKADIIIVLKPNLLIRTWRITKRFIRRKTGIEKSKKKETIKEFLKLLKWNARYDKKNLPKVWTFIEPYSNNVVVIEKSNLKDLILSGHINA